MKTAIISMLALVLVTAFGSYHQSEVVPYIVIGAVCAVAILVALGKIKPRQYPIYIYGMSLALLWQTSMLGHYIVGADIHSEYFIVNRAIAQGWDLDYGHIYNTSMVLGGLSPLLAKIGIPVLWQFKAVYPVLFAGVPLILYFAYRKMMGEKRAFWASLFFMVVAVFFVEIVGIVKSMTAEVFLALMVLFFALDLNAWQKGLGVGLSVILASLCHYTVGIVAVMYIVGGLLVLLACKAVNRGVLRRLRMSVVAYLGSALIAVAVVSILWFGSVSGGLILNSYKVIGGGMVDKVVGYFDFGKADGTEVVPNPGEVVDTRPGADGVLSTYYMCQREPLVATAIGLDFPDASVGGKAFRVLQYLTELSLFLGFGYLLFRHRKYKFTAEFASCIAVSFVLLGLCVFWAGFSSMINVERFYQIALFFLAPMLVVGVEELVGDVGRGMKLLKSKKVER